jgi:hypothetical protein
MQAAVFRESVTRLYRGDKVNEKELRQWQQESVQQAYERFEGEIMAELSGWVNPS